jgi:hypothetical protein
VAFDQVPDDASANRTSATDPPVVSRIVPQGIIAGCHV